MPSQTFELLTPCFCRGADRNKPELRVASIRGQLHFWARMLLGTGRPEFELLGGVQDTIASAIGLSLSLLSPQITNHELFCPHAPRKGGGLAILPGLRFTLSWRLRPGVPLAVDETFRRVLKAWSLLGGLGLRSNRAAGSVWPIFGGGELSVAQFTQVVAKLGLPSTSTVRILPNNAQCDAVKLREIATDTVNGLGPGTFTNDPLGCIGRGSRKSSPFKLKVGRFLIDSESAETDYRLIAVWDDRNGRGGDFAAALAAMGTAILPKDLANLITASGGWP